MLLLVPKTLALFSNAYDPQHFASMIYPVLCASQCLLVLVTCVCMAIILLVLITEVKGVIIKTDNPCKINYVEQFALTKVSHHTDN